ncbi:MAG: carboxypeptidase regulatory-like domain-containing protein [Gemmatimonadales bacterium]
MHRRNFSILALAVLVSAAAGTPLHRSAKIAVAPGSIEGTISYTGTPPKMRPIDMAKEPSCAKQHATPVFTESVGVRPGNTLEDVVIYVSAGDEGAPATKTVEYDQKGCQYMPHVAALEVNQPLEISNHDQTSHNIHPMAKVNSEWNKSQPPGTPSLHVTYTKAEFIPVKCNVHPWMHGYFAVLNTSHYSVSDDNGKFVLKGLPPGKYTLTAWQEKFGTQTQDVTVGSGATAKADFTFKATPY